jgi:hypothetical protein
MSARVLFFRRISCLSAATAPLLALLALVCVAACAKGIGDSCSTNVDCSPLGDRFCDLSSPSGYCTLEGCNATSCPNNTVCIRFFSLQRGTAQCDPTKIPRSDCNGGSDCCDPGTAGCCNLGDTCLCDQEGCTLGYCASQTTEHRWCMAPCNSDSDCRSMYQCYTTNQRGAIAVATYTDAGVLELPVLQYCAPALTE